MNQILDIAGKPPRRRKAQYRRIKKQDMRDLGKIATVIAVIAIGYFHFAPEASRGDSPAAAMARK